MRSWFRVGGIATGLAAGAFVACGFSPAVTDGGPGDVAADAGPCERASAQCADDTTLRVCTGSGATAIDTTCKWGCLGSSSHCGDLRPAGGGVIPMDVTDSAGLSDVV